MKALSEAYDLVGVGIGPFNLSLAALAAPLSGLKSLFFDSKKDFLWHPELMMPGVTMQTSFLKDLVTGVDPTSSFTFLNYLLQRQCLYGFLNTGRQNVTRQEFELYGKWVAQQLPNLSFSSSVRKVSFDGELFNVHVGDEIYRSQHISLGTGPVPHIPDVAKPFLSDTCFHPKTRGLSGLKLEGQRVAIVGGGQTAAEIFSHAMDGLWGETASLTMLTRRENLSPLDESPFANEYFTPDYVRQFRQLSPAHRHRLVDQQKLTSDGITLSLLEEIYQKLFTIRMVGGRNEPQIMPFRELTEMWSQKDGYLLEFTNNVLNTVEHIEVDTVILATGFSHRLPPIVDSLVGEFGLEGAGHACLTQDYEVKWPFMRSNHIFLQNFGRYSIGISEPQTSLMAFRSGKILNRILCCDHFNTSNAERSFLRLSKSNRGAFSSRALG